MKKKIGIFTVLAASMLLALPAISQAWQGHGGGHGMVPPCGNGQAYAVQGWQHPQIAPEQQEAFEKIMAAHHEKSWSLRSDLSAKRMELEYLSQNPKTEPKTISSLIGDVKNLKSKLHDLNKTTAASLQKELGISNEHAYALTMGGGCGQRQMMGGRHMGDRHHRF